MQNLRKFFQAFSEIKGFDNWMIGKIKIKQKGNGPDIAEKEKYCRIKKRKRHFAVLEAEGQEMRMEVFLLKPDCAKMTEEKKIRKSLPKDLGKCVSKVFSREEILAFVKETGDDNPIHFSKSPVVPGFLMLEWLWQLGYAAKEMIFYSPVYAQEEVTLYFHQGTKDCYALSGGICWEAKGKWKAE